ncbi:ribbon-helix-helix protein, CopG family [Anabaena sp. CCY 9910]|uniref:ribbon-helix-helix protein, CopG family n=1 Tax=Anabaena sp. CCY 9910 TaxID=3103870 RepID=UPI0039E0444F
MTTRIDIRLPEQELEILKTYCQEQNRTQTEVIREFIRSLKKKSKTNDLAITRVSNPSNCPPIPHHRQSEYRCGGSTPEI